MENRFAPDFWTTLPYYIKCPGEALHSAQLGPIAT